MCEQQGRTVVATHVDHITPHKGQHGLLYDLDNLQSLCETCHQAVKQAEERGHMRGAGVDGVPLDAGHHWRTEETRPMVMTLIRGLPGAGKSELAAALASRMGAVHLEYDQFMMDADGNRVHDEATVLRAVAECKAATKRALEAGQSVVVSNTFSRRFEMNDFLAMAEHYRVQLQMVETWSQWDSVHDVPDDAMKSIRDRWQPVDAIWRDLQAERAPR